VRLSREGKHASAEGESEGRYLDTSDSDVSARSTTKAASREAFRRGRPKRSLKGGVLTLATATCQSTTAAVGTDGDLESAWVEMK
jgi:hypothetical protein